MILGGSVFKKRSSGLPPPPPPPVPTSPPLPIEEGKETNSNNGENVFASNPLNLSSSKKKKKKNIPPPPEDELKAPDYLPPDIINNEIVPPSHPPPLHEKVFLSTNTINIVELQNKNENESTYIVNDEIEKVEINILITRNESKSEVNDNNLSETLDLKRASSVRMPIEIENGTYQIAEAFIIESPKTKALKKLIENNEIPLPIDEIPLPSDDDEDFVPLPIDNPTDKGESELILVSHDKDLNNSSVTGHSIEQIKEDLNHSIKITQNWRDSMKEEILKKSKPLPRKNKNKIKQPILKTPATSMNPSLKRLENTVKDVNTLTRIKHYIQWIKVMKIWSDITPDQFHYHFKSGLLLCSMLCHIVPNLEFKGLFGKAIVKATCINNLEKALTVIWRRKVMTSNMPTAEKVYNVEKFWIESLLQEVFSAFILVEVKKTLPRMVVWMNEIFKIYGCSTSNTTNSSQNIDDKDFKSGTRLLCICHYYASTIPYKNTDSYIIDSKLIWWNPSDIEEHKSNIKYLFQTFNLLRIPIVTLPSDYLENADVDFFNFQIYLLYKTFLKCDWPIHPSFEHSSFHNFASPIKKEGGSSILFREKGNERIDILQSVDEPDTNSNSVFDFDPVINEIVCNVNVSEIKIEKENQVAETNIREEENNRIDESKDEAPKNTLENTIPEINKKTNSQYEEYENLLDRVLNSKNDLAFSMNELTKSRRNMIDKCNIIFKLESTLLKYQKELQLDREFYDKVIKAGNNNRNYELLSPKNNSKLNATIFIKSNNRLIEDDDILPEKEVEELLRWSTPFSIYCKESFRKLNFFIKKAEYIYLYWESPDNNNDSALENGKIALCDITNIYSSVDDSTNLKSLTIAIDEKCLIAIRDSGALSKLSLVFEESKIQEQFFKALTYLSNVCSKRI